MKVGHVLAAVVAILPLSSGARATEENEAPRRWYGWQTLAVYSVADPMFATGAPHLDVRHGSDVGLVLGALSIHELAGPVVHFAHGNVGRGFGSLGINLLTSGAGAGVGALLGFVVTVGTPPCFEFNVLCDRDRTENTLLIATITGGAVGLFAANVVDIAALAYDHPRRREPAAGWTVAPLLSPTMKGAAIAGAF